MYIRLTIFCIFSIFLFIECTESESNQSHAVNVNSNLAVQSIKTERPNIDTCKIELQSFNSTKDIECGMVFFEFQKNKVLIDSNLEFTAVLNLLPGSRKEYKIFNYYDLPTGRQKIILFDLKNKRVYQSDFYDDSAIGDSVDVKSINVTNKFFHVFQKNINEPYNVKLNFLRNF